MIATPDITNRDCSVTPLVANLVTTRRTRCARAARIGSFAREHNTAADDKRPTRFLLAGSAGIEAATNIEVERGIVTMYLAVYGATALLCLLTFRSCAPPSWR
jgi:predicted RND superfamily exporter protein